jgi:hypothetical protein
MWWAVLLLWFVGIAAHADESPAWEHLKCLESFIGAWECQTVIPESPSYSESGTKWQGKPLLLKANISWSAGRCAQIVDSVFEVPGEVTIHGTLVWGWDETVQTFKGTRFTSHKGVWSESMRQQGDAWVSEYCGTNLDGAKCSGTTTTTFPDADTMVMVDANQTMDGKPIPDMTYNFKRVRTPGQPSHYEKIKDLEMFIGQWKAVTEGGVTYDWVLEWTADKNFIQNVLTRRDGDGATTMSNKGYFGWDPNYRRISNWCVDIYGNRPVFLWEKQPDGTWHTWAPGGSYQGAITIMEDGSWCMDGGGEALHFKRVATE